MENEIDLKAVKENLLLIYRRFYLDPNDKENWENANKLYFEYINLPHFVGREIGFAIYCLIDVLGARPISKEQVKRIIEDLEKADVGN